MSSTDANVIAVRDWEISFFDGATYATSSNTYTVTGEEGNLTLGGGGVAVETFLDRGQLIGDAGYPLSRLTDDRACTVGFTAYLRKITDASAATLYDIARRVANFPAAQCGAASGWANQLSTSDAFNIGVRIRASKAGSGAGGYFSLEYRYCTGEIEASDGNPSTLNLTLTSATNSPTIS